MCGPAAIPIIALVITAAGTGYSVYQQNQQVHNQNRFQDEMAKQGADLANANFRNQSSAENEKLSQQNDAAAQQLQQNQKEASKAKATAAVSAGEAGVSGVSIDALQADYNRQEAIFSNSVATNQSWQRAQSASNMEAFRAGALDRIAATTPNLQSAPGYYGAALRIGGQGLDTYNTNYRNK